MRKTLIAIASLAAGAAAMYYLDPEQGRRRRALVREKTGSIAHQARERAASQTRYVADRARGLATGAKRRLWPFGQPDDLKLEQRVRAQLGHLVTHPQAIEIDVAAGCVRLRGRALRHEIGTLITGLWGVPGVQRIVNELSLHGHANDTTDWQGAGARVATTPVGTAARKMLPLVAVAAPMVWLAANGRALFASRSVH